MQCNHFECKFFKCLNKCICAIHFSFTPTHVRNETSRHSLVISVNLILLKYIEYVSEVEMLYVEKINQNKFSTFATFSTNLYLEISLYEKL